MQSDGNGTSEWALEDSAAGAAENSSSSASRGNWNETDKNGWSKPAEPKLLPLQGLPSSREEESESHNPVNESPFVRAGFGLSMSFTPKTEAATEGPIVDSTAAAAAAAATAAASDLANGTASFESADKESSSVEMLGQEDHQCPCTCTSTCLCKEAPKEIFSMKNLQDRIKELGRSALMPYLFMMILFVGCFAVSVILTICIALFIILPIKIAKNIKKLQQKMRVFRDMFPTSMSSATA